MMLRTILKLGRVSNLPTVWTNALAGAVLTAQADLDTVLVAGLALTAFYTGGIDGDFGPGTQRGIRKAYGLEE